MHILITGAGGKMGRVLANTFAPDHTMAYATHTPTEGLPPGQQYAGDITDGAFVERMVAAEKPEVIIHLAALLPAACVASPETAARVNAYATGQLAAQAAAHGVARFIFASTSAVYNQRTLHPVTEQEAATSPVSVYGATKLQGEHAVAAAIAGTGTGAVALRIFNVYGPAFTDSLVYKLAHSSATEPVTVLGPDNFYRDYVHSGDVAVAFAAALLYEGVTPGSMNTYNIAGGTAISNAMLIDALRGQGLDLHYKVRQATLSVTWADISIARRDLGFTPRDGIIADS